MPGVAAGWSSTVEAIGRAFGIDSFRASNNAEFDEVLEDVLAKPRPAVVEIMEGDERLTAWGNLTTRDQA